jgi:RNA polymerase sigma-70 factor, ECF subfamily
MNPPLPADDEPRLIRAAQQRDPTAFAALVLRHQRRIRSFLAVRLRHHHDVEDLTQEVFVTAFRKIDQCHPEGPMEPWLRRIATNLLLNHRRKFRATPVGLAEEFLASLDRRVEAYCEGDREVAALEALQQCLGEVEDSSRRLLQARYEHEVPMEELARQLGRKASSVSMQLHRLRVALGNCIGAKLQPGAEPT